MPPKFVSIEILLSRNTQTVIGKIKYINKIDNKRQILLGLL
jgi:hypothetical protein